MAQEQTTASNRTGQADAEQPSHLVQAVTALKDRTRQALSPWVQRHLDRARARPVGRRGREPYERTAVSGSHTLSLVKHLQRVVERTIVWRPGVGSLSPAMVQRFARTVANRSQPLELVGTRLQPRQSLTGWGDDLELILPTGPGASAAASGDLTAGSRLRGPSVFSVGQRIPPMASSSSPGPRAPRVPTRQAPRRPQRKPLPRDARLFTHVVEVTPDQPTVPEADLSVGIAADEEVEATDEQEMTAQPPAPAGPPPAPRQAEPAPRPPSAPAPKAASGRQVQRQARARPPSRPSGQGKAEAAQPASELAAFFAAPRPAPPERPTAAPTDEAPPPEQEVAEPTPAPEKEVPPSPGAARLDQGPEPLERPSPEVATGRPTIRRQMAPETPRPAAPATPAPGPRPERRPPTRQPGEALPSPLQEGADQPLGVQGTAPSEPEPSEHQEARPSEILLPPVQRAAGEEMPGRAAPATGSPPEGPEGAAPARRPGTRPPAAQRKVAPAAEGKAIQRKAEPAQDASGLDGPPPGPEAVETETAAGPGEPTTEPAEAGPEPGGEGELEMPVRLPPSVQAAPAGATEATPPAPGQETGPAGPPKERAGGRLATQAGVQRQEQPPAGEPVAPPAPAPAAAEPDVQRRAQPPTGEQAAPPLPAPQAPEPDVQRRAQPPTGEQVPPPLPASRTTEPDVQRREQPPAEELAPPPEGKRPERPAMPLRTGPRQEERRAPTPPGPEVAPPPVQRESEGPARPQAPPLARERLAGEPPPERREAAQAPTEPPPVEMPLRTAQRQEMPAGEGAGLLPQRPTTPEGGKAEEDLVRDLWARARSHAQMPLSHLAAPPALRSGRVQRQPATGEPARLLWGPVGWRPVRGLGAMGRRSLSPALLPRTPERYIGPDLSLPVSAPAVGRRVQRSLFAGPEARPKPPSPPDLMQAFLAAWPAEEEGQMILPPPPRPTAPPAPARAVRAQPEARRPTPSPLSLTQPQVQPLPASPTIQRQVAAAGAPADLMAPVRGEFVQRTADEEEEETEKVDLTDLARLVYPYVKRMLAVERERRPRW